MESYTLLKEAADISLLEETVWMRRGGARMYESTH